MMTSWRELPRFNMDTRSRKNVLEASVYQTIAYMDCAIVVRESQRARAKMLQATGSYRRLKIDAVGYWKSVPSVRRPGRIVATSSPFQLLSTLYGDAHKLRTRDNHYLDELGGTLKEPK